MKIIFFSKRRLFIVWIILGLCLASVYMTKVINGKDVETFASPIRGKTIVIDAGHGGFDPGAVSSGGTREDEINLKISKKLKEYLDNQGVNVVMTRETGEALASTKRQDMQKRVEIIRDSNCDALISIHLNKFGQSRYYGAQTFYMTGSVEGKDLAYSIQSKLIEVLDRDNKRKIKPVEDLMILKASGAPAVIVECGFISNPEEEKLLKDDGYQDKIAWAIYCGLIDYYTSQNMN